MCEANIARLHAVVGRVDECLVRNGSVIMVRGSLRQGMACRHCGSDDSEAL